MLDRVVRLGGLLALAFAWSACGGGGPGLTPPGQAGPGPGGADQVPASTTYTLSAAGSTQPLPAVGGYGGTVTFPAFAVPPGATIVASASASVTAAAQRAMARRATSATGTANVYYALQLTPSRDLVMPSVPSYDLQLPPAAHPADQQFFYAISQPAPAGAAYSFRTEGPASVDGRTLIFPASAIPLTLKAGVTYTFRFYGMANAAATPSALLFAADGYGNDVVAFPLGGNGDTAPVRVIAGPHTGLHGPTGIAHDAAGNLYVANEGANTITEYPADANGDVPPMRTIVQTDPTNLAHTVAIGATGTVYVGNAAGVGAMNSVVTVYAATASGSAPPIRTIGLASPAAGIAIDPAGELVVGNPPAVEVFAPDADGNAVPLRTIAGASTGLGSLASLSTGPDGRLYVADDSYPAPSVAVFAANANGNAAPVARIQGPLTRLGIAVGVAADDAGTVYVANSTAYNAAEIDVFAPNASGNVAPVRVIGGPSTGMRDVLGLTVLPRALAYP